MSRPLRIEYPGAVYHVTSGGDARRPIFADDKDRLTFPATMQGTWLGFPPCRPAEPIPDFSSLFFTSLQ
jgi:hypothetical protein